MEIPNSFVRDHTPTQNIKLFQNSLAYFDVPQKTFLQNWQGDFPLKSDLYFYQKCFIVILIDCQGVQGRHDIHHNDIQYFNIRTTKYDIQHNNTHHLMLLCSAECESFYRVLLWCCVSTHRVVKPRLVSDYYILC